MCLHLPYQIFLAQAKLFSKTEILTKEFFFFENDQYNSQRAAIEHKALPELGYIFSLLKLCISCVGEEDGGQEEKRFIPSQIPLLNG